VTWREVLPIFVYLIIVVCHFPEARRIEVQVKIDKSSILQEIKKLLDKIFKPGNGEDAD